jgi:superfamily II DNA or RNA helicase
MNKNYIGKKGYTIYKENISTSVLKKMCKDLYVKPYIPNQYANDLNNKPFPVYLESKKKIYIPKFYGIKEYGKLDINKIEDGKSINIKFKYDLRDNQKPVVEKYLEVAKDIGGGIISVPCGFGKTVIALYLLAALGKKTLVIVHKEFLMDQWKERIEFFLPDAKIGKIQGKVINTEGCDIVLGMLQSISMRDYDEDVFSEFGMVIYDECHHLGAEVFSRSLLKLNCKYTLGLSATPTRTDGLSKVFEWFLGDIVYLIKKREQEKVKVKMIEYYTEDEKYSDIKVNFKGQVNLPGMINNICAYEPRSLVILKEIEECIKEKRKILILSDRRKHLEYLKTKLDELKFCTAGYYLGGMKQEQLKESESKDVMLATYSMASEGFDCKELNTLIFASPKSNIEQSVGRILRMRKEDRKVDPLVIDFVDKFSIFGRQSEKRKKFYEKNNYEIEIFK